MWAKFSATLQRRNFTFPYICLLSHVTQMLKGLVTPKIKTQISSCGGNINKSGKFDNITNRHRCIMTAQIGAKYYDCSRSDCQWPPYCYDVTGRYISNQWHYGESWKNFYISQMTRLLVICSVSFSRTSVLVIIRRLAVLEDAFVLAEREICQPLLGPRHCILYFIFYIFCYRVYSFGHKYVMWAYMRPIFG